MERREWVVKTEGRHRRTEFNKGERAREEEKEGKEVMVVLEKEEREEEEGNMREWLTYTLMILLMPMSSMGIIEVGHINRGIRWKGMMEEGEEGGGEERREWTWDT